MLENGADIRFIQQLLGHEKLDTTAIYTEVSIKQLQEVHARCYPSAKHAEPAPSATTTAPATGLNLNPNHRMLNTVPITLEQIVEETRHWPPEKVGELVGRLTEDLHASDPETEAAWKEETRRRLAEIENGTVQPVDGNAVSARIRQIVGR